VSAIPTTIKFELLADSNGVKTWKVEAIHATITGNRRRYLEAELAKAAETLSNKPLNINHDPRRQLPYPENRTLDMRYSPEKKAIVGTFQVADPNINLLIEKGMIAKVSIEQTPEDEKCDMTACTQIGMKFKAMALLESFLGVQPGDPNADIITESLKCEEVLLSDLVGECSCKKPAGEVLQKPDAGSSQDEPRRSESRRMSAEPNAKPAEAKPTGPNVMTEEQVKALVSGVVGPIVSTMQESFKNIQQIQLEKLSEQIGLVKASLIKESAAKPSSTVDDSKKIFESTVQNPAKWFEAVKHGTNETDYTAWNVNKEAFYASLQKAVLRTPENGTKKEAITFNATDRPQVFDKTLYVLPGGRMKVPIRQFLNVKEITAADRVNFYKGDAFDVDDSTSEGTEPTNKSQTITKVQVVPALKRAVQTINYTDIEDAPFDLVQYVNEAAMLGALNVEAKEVLTTTYDAVTVTNWVRGDTGADLAGGTDDVAGVGGLTVEGIMAGLELIESGGYDTTAGNCVLFAHPHQIRQLAVSVKSDYFTSDMPLTQRDIGVIERRLGVDIVPTNAVKKTSGAVNTNCYRAVLAVKGYSLGLASAANLQIEAQKKVELSAVKIAARHRIKGSVIDELSTVRISTKTT
jgi:hypothetical protein